MNLMKITTSFAVVALTLFASTSFAQLGINEYSCSNMNGYTDNFGENEDWIEIYNGSGAAVDLTGYYLSDRAGNLMKWQIPSGSVPSNGYLLAFASKRDMVSGGELHTNFNLKQTTGDWIILSDPTGTVVDSIKIVHLTQTDHSCGRQTDGAPDWKLFLNPTPGAANTGAIDFYEPTPVMDIAPGFYPGAQNVTLTCSDPGATIRYTTDGSYPTGASTAYSGPINISTTAVLRATAFGTNEPSFTETNTYFINVTHTVPVVSVCSDEVYDLVANGNQGGGWGGGGANKLGGFELFEQDGTFIDEGDGDFNKHGNDSWSYDQRGFDFIMRDQFGYNDDIDHQIFPLDTDREDFQRIILKPGASDNYPFENGAHIRDAFVHTLSIRADMLLDERTWRPCVVYLNGEYWGVYEIREKADDHDYTDYYYAQDKFNLQYLKTWGGTWEEYGAPNAQSDWDALVAFILANNMGPGPDFDYVTSQLKWASLSDYFMFNSYVVNQDWLNWNTAWWRGMDPAGSKKKWRYTLWDMDATFGHYINYTGIPDPSANADPCNAENLPDPGGQGHTAILQKLIDENPVVEQYYVTRYIDLVNTHFSCAYMNNLLDSMVNILTPEMTGQANKWGGSLAGWQANIQTLRDFIDARCLALEQGLIDCYDLTGPFDVVFDVDPTNSGEIKVNSIWPPNYPWTTQYYGGIQTNTIAVPQPGFMFDHWEYSIGPLINAITEDTNGLEIMAPDSVIAFFVPLNPDIDGDGILNDDETGCLDPLNPDTDGDGINDGDEVAAGSDPCNPCDPDPNSAVCDADGDGLFANEEIGPCLDDTNTDVDGDGLSDYEEVTGIDDPATPLVPTGISDPCDPCDPDDSDLSCQIDTDGDGVTDAAEISGGTDPNEPCSYNISQITLPITAWVDCDGDGINDDVEITDGSDPFDPCDPNNSGIECILGVHVPTGFSPNGSGANETYSIIVGKDVTSIIFSVYDRWGNQMFQSAENDFEWDGTFHGQPCNVGVYAYVLEIVYDNGTGELRTGNITLVK
ncbi:MAG: CotH kinase family protein [Crocinitomicaceae bacterium]|nr:CotH kinase family protein [Crocinitomicaceae bacterium]